MRTQTYLKKRVLHFMACGNILFFCLIETAKRSDRNMASQPDKKSSTTPRGVDNTGHRQRLRERFARAGLNGLQDYEAIELLLSYAIMRRDVKPLAKELLRDFGSLAELMDAPMEKLIDEHGMGPSSALLIKLMKEMCAQYLEQRARAVDVIRDCRQAEDFVRMKLGGGSRETMMTIFLNAHNHIISYDLNPGTVNHASIYVRELVKRAMLCNATGVIIAHNHPSGVCIASPEDIRLTSEIRTALNTVGIKLYDHFIVTRTACRRIK